MIEARIIETVGDPANLPEFLRETKPPQVDFLGKDELKKLQTAKGLNLVAAPKIITRSGQRAEIRTTKAYNYPADWEKDGATGPWKAKKTAAEDLGLSFEVTPLVEPDGVIELTLVSKVVELTDLRDLDDPAKDEKANPARVIPEGHRSQPVFTTQKITSTATVIQGGTVAVSGLESSKKRMLFLVSAKIVTAEGKPAMPPDELIEVKPAPPSGGVVPGKEAAPEKDAPPVKETPVKDTPAKETPVKETPVKETPVKDAPAKEASPAKKPDAVRDLDPLDINADTMGSNDGIATAAGNVRVAYQDVSIKGDRMTYDPKTRAVTVIGNVRFEKGTKEITAENLTYWLDNGRIDTKGPSKVRLKDVSVPK